MKNNELRKKNGAHTNSCTTVQFKSEYSRRLLSILARNTKKKIQAQSYGFRTTMRYWILEFALKVVNIIEKKTEHTRMYAQLCSSLTQYSRQLLSILARHRAIHTKSNVVW